MKKLFMLLAIIAAVFSASSCACNKSSEETAAPNECCGECDETELECCDSTCVDCNKTE